MELLFFGGLGIVAGMVAIAFGTLFMIVWLRDTATSRRERRYNQIKESRKNRVYCNYLTKFNNMRG